MDNIEKLLLIVLFIAILYYPLCGIVGFIEFVQGRKRGRGMTENERKNMMILADTIQGEINRMCVTKELAEFDAMYGFAKRNLDNLSKIIYDDRFKVESEDKA